MRMKRMIYITDSMTSAELDSDGSLFLEMGKDGKPVDLTWRVTRVARGSGTSVREVEELLCQYQMMANMAKQAGGKNGWLSAMQKMQSAAGGRGRGANGMPTQAQIQAMQVRQRTPFLVSLCPRFTLPPVARNASRDVAEYAETDAWWRSAGDDEDLDAEPGRGRHGHGRDAADDVSNGRRNGRNGRTRRTGWRYAQHGRHVQDDGWHGRRFRRPIVQYVHLYRYFLVGSRFTF